MPGQPAEHRVQAIAPDHARVYLIFNAASSPIIAPNSEPWLSKLAVSLNVSLKGRDQIKNNFPK